MRRWDASFSPEAACGLGARAGSGRHPRALGCAWAKPYFKRVVYDSGVMAEAASRQDEFPESGFAGLVPREARVPRVAARGSGLHMGRFPWREGPRGGVSPRGVGLARLVRPEN